jgi:hypothetical protein
MKATRDHRLLALGSPITYFPLVKVTVHVADAPQIERPSPLQSHPETRTAIPLGKRRCDTREPAIPPFRASQLERAPNRQGNIAWKTRFPGAHTVTVTGSWNERIELVSSRLMEH